MTHGLEKLIREAAAEAGSPEPQSSIETHAVEAVNAAPRRSLYQKREPIYPKRMDGFFRRIKWAAMLVLLGIYYVTPWLRFDRGPEAPNQAVLLDLPARRFYFFFLEIWPQEIYYLTGLLILGAIGLFLATSLAGRLWCGYACPQTVWTDLFIAVEKFFEGGRNRRIKLARGGWTLDKILRKTGKHVVWILVAMATGGAWVFYFADAPTLAHRLLMFDAPAVAYITIAILTGTTYLLGGFSREQVCTYMCPWPRIQGAMFDEESLAVTYRFDRGEPRAPHKKGDTWDGRGDCIDCKQCVVVCPVGIDIRDGLQLECIQCALCIDACNDVMDKIGRPRGLIAYDTDANLERRQKGEPERFRFIRPRTLGYTAMLVFVSAIMVYGLATRSPVELNVQRDRNPLFVTLSGGEIRNGYTLKILNKRHDVGEFTVALDGLAASDIKLIGIPGDGTVIRVSPDSVRPVRLFISAPRNALGGNSTPLTLTVTDLRDGRQVTVDTSFKGP